MTKKIFYFMSDVDSAIGNFSEVIFYALLKAKRTGTKFVLVRKYIFFRSIMSRKLGLRQPRALYNVNMEYSAKGDIFGYLLAFYGGAQVLVSHLYWSIRYKFAKLLNSIAGRDILECSFSPIATAFGTKDLFNIHSQETFSYSVKDELYWHDALSTRFEIEFDETVTKDAKNSFTKLGLYKYPWYACLHIRTPFFYNSTHAEFRNSDIKNYYEAIRYITSLGGAVVRMGDPMPDVEYIDGLVNYPNSTEKSEEMDLYLIKNCKFYIGTNSGIFDTAMLFGAPVLSVNTTDYLFPKPYKTRDSFIYKHIYSKIKGRVLTFKEAFEEPFFINSNVMVGRNLQKFYDDYELVENTSEEILVAVRNFIQNLENASFEKTKAQDDFENHLKMTIMKWIDTEEYFRKDVDQAYRVFSKLQYNGSIDRDFAERYYDK